MGVKDKDKSLLEIAVELLATKHQPQTILQIAKEAMEIKGLKTAQAKELLPQFLLDFQSSGYFVYCGDDCWDLKDRQPTSVLDKDGGDYEDLFENDEDVKKNELKDGAFDASYADENNYESPIIVNDEDGEEDDDEDENDEDDLSNEFEVLVDSVEDEEEDED